mmetsp:Transcript_49799/g.131046  ORF Transcript_49799/g.131046 Transcript_49799/m.131046 type:complete len:149 (+) Transcript_49799:236-682(+)
MLAFGDASACLRHRCGSGVAVSLECIIHTSKFSSFASGRPGRHPGCRVPQPTVAASTPLSESNFPHKMHNFPQGSSRLLPFDEEAAPSLAISHPELSSKIRRRGGPAPSSRRLGTPVLAHQAPHQVERDGEERHGQERVEHGGDQLAH